MKAASKATAFLTSSELTTWNYGTLDQRLALGHWATIGDRIRELLLGGWIWVPLLLVLLWQARKLGFWLGWLLTIVLPIAVFFNLFWIHDYYLAAISPAIARRSVSESTSCTPTSRRVAVVAGVIALLVWLTPVTWTRTVRASRVREELGSGSDHAVRGGLAEKSAPGDRVLVDGGDWNPAVLYCGPRRDDVGARRCTPVSTLGSRGRARGTARGSPTSGRAVNSITSARGHGSGRGSAHRLGHRVGDVTNASVIATTDVAQCRRRQRRARATTIVVPCTGKPVAVPAGAVGTWMVPTKTPPAGLRLTIAGSAPLPAFAAYAVRALPEGPDSPKTIQTSCRGPQAVTLRVFHTPVP